MENWNRVACRRWEMRNGPRYQRRSLQAHNFGRAHNQRRIKAKRSRRARQWQDECPPAADN